MKDEKTLRGEKSFIGSVYRLKFVHFVSKISTIGTFFYHQMRYKAAAPMYFIYRF